MLTRAGWFRLCVGWGQEQGGVDGAGSAFSKTYWGSPIGQELLQWADVFGCTWWGIGGEKEGVSADMHLDLHTRLLPLESIYCACLFPVTAHRCKGSWEIKPICFIVTGWLNKTAELWLVKRFFWSHYHQHVLGLSWTLAVIRTHRENSSGFSAIRSIRTGPSSVKTCFNHLSLLVIFTRFANEAKSLQLYFMFMLKKRIK